MAHTVALAQINTKVAAFEANVERILSFARDAQGRGAQLVVFPEMVVCGYPPLDLLDFERFVDLNLAALRKLQHELPPELYTVVGLVDRTRGTSGKPIQNVAVLIHRGQIIHRQAKTLLPSYDVFDESRYFQPADKQLCFEMEGKRIGVAICEDMWWETEPQPGARYPVDPIQNLLDDGAELLIVLSASPFHEGKVLTRSALMRGIGESSGVAVIYTNLVGANDELVFDGNSLVSNQAGQIVAQAAGFAEDILLVQLDDTLNPLPPPCTVRRERQADLVAAMELGLKDYLGKTGFSKVHLGLSGGIDSALVATIAARALGKQNVLCFLLPSRYSSSGSVDDSIELCKRQGLAFETLAIEKGFSALLETLDPVFTGTTAGVAEENLQARIRGTLLMSYSNKFGSLLLTTGNKSELSVGYCTLYGDMSGGFDIIGDLYKTEVYELCEWLNRDKEVIPRTIIEKAPSAELRPNQKDQDSLPPYDLLDAILKRHIEGRASAPELIAEGFDPTTVNRVLKLVAVNEYKRWQAAPVLKLSAKSFGIGRRVPIARHFYELDV